MTSLRDRVDAAGAWLVLAALGLVVTLSLAGRIEMVAIAGKEQTA